MEEEQLEIINDNENIQLAENENVDNYDNDEELYANKSELLEKTRIVKQTWSIIEIYQKINDKTILGKTSTYYIYSNNKDNVAYLNYQRTYETI